MTVLFDLDGTLTDPKPGITRCCAYALERMGAGIIDPDSLAWCIGPPLRGSFAQILETEDPETIERAVAFYRERFADIGLFENEVYAGIPEVLSALRESGADLYVATSKPEVFSIRIIEHFGLDRYFSGLVGSELDGTRDAKADVIAHLLKKYEVDPREALMVGDRKHDVIGASAHGIPCVGALYGYGLPGELEEAGAYPLCASPAELLKACQRSAVMPNTSMS